jgi:F0F1-type ATP synthase assembly protein I
MDGWKAAFRVLGMGWYVAIAIVLGLLGGLWLDGKFHTRPFFTIVGLVAGITAAIYGVYQMFLPFFKNKQGKGDS